MELLIIQDGFGDYNYEGLLIDCLSGSPCFILSCYV